MNLPNAEQVVSDKNSIMMNTHYILNDVVTLLKPCKVIAQGAIGTIVEKLGKKTYLVEFCDDQGHMVALEPLKESQLLKVKSSPMQLYQH